MDHEDILFAQESFNGATRLHAWKRRYCAALCGRDHRFNGATRLHAWKRLRHSGQYSDEELLQWSHASSRVETTPTGSILLKDYVLQWSHASSRVETAQGSKCYLNHPPGFNGATRLHAWKRDCSPRLLKRRWCFN